VAVSSSNVIRDGEVTRRVGGNDINEIENNFARNEIFYRLPGELRMHKSVRH